MKRFIPFFIALALGACSKDSDPVPTKPALMTFDEIVRDHLKGNLLVSYEHAPYGLYYLHLPDGSTAVVDWIIAQNLCINYNGRWCDYKKYKNKKGAYEPLNFFNSVSIECIRFTAVFLLIRYVRNASRE